MVSKEQKLIINAMIRTTYSEVVFRSIAILLMVRVGGRFESMEIEDGNKLTPEQRVYLKKQYAKELLKDSRVKKDIELDIDDISRKKTDMVYEIMRHYSLHKNISEATYYHDQLSIIFDQSLWKIRACVRKGDWGSLGI